MVLSVLEVSKSIILNDSELGAISRVAANNSTIKYNLTELGQTLQLSLETDKILQLFFKHIKQYFKLSKLLYINTDNHTHILLGSKLNGVSGHIKSYELFYKKEYLGEINFASKVKLAPSKVLELKVYVNSLILPLRNSLLYCKAIKETRMDPLTKIGNRMALIEDLTYHFNLSSRYNTPLSLLFIDIDYFKKINDTYGHIVGDKILISLAEFLTSKVRKSDKIYRFGGEEFVVILENTNQNGALSLAKKLKTAINNTKFHDLAITCSMGIATKKRSDTCESMSDRADKALYMAKNNGRNTFVVGE